MSKTWLSSDFHFNHSNIVLGTTTWTDTSGCRDFDTVADMDNVILDNINTLVMPEDTLRILGDFAFGSNKLEVYRKYRSLIRCKTIHYIRGNHSPRNDKDPKKDKEIRKALMEIFTTCNELVHTTIHGRMFSLCHYMLVNFPKQGKGAINCFAHSHGNLKIPLVSQLRCKDVGVDTNNMKPYNVVDIIDEMEARPILSLDHHCPENTDLKNSQSN